METCDDLSLRDDDNGGNVTKPCMIFLVELVPKIGRRTSEYLYELVDGVWKHVMIWACEMITMVEMCRVLV